MAKFSPRKAVILVFILICCLYFFYPTTPSDSSPKSTTSAINSKDFKKIPPDQQPETLLAESKLPKVPVVRGSSQSQQRLKIDKLQRLPLREQLAYQFPYVVESRFPAFIWQTWKYTPASPKFEDKFRETEASWTEQHPTFVHEVGTLIYLDYV